MLVSDPSWSLREALFATLSTALSCSVFDDVEPGTQYPYVTIDYENTEEDDYLNSRKDLRFLYLSVWSEYRGQQEVIEIMEEIYAALHQVRLPLSNGRMVSMEVWRRRTSREPDGVTYMGQVTLRIRTQH